jgi:hypothetical protein
VKIGTTLVNSTISPAPLTYNLGGEAYTLNIGGWSGHQDPDTTAQADIKGVDIHPNDLVTIRFYDTRYIGYSEFTFYSNSLGIVLNEIEKTENSLFNSRFRPGGGYEIFSALNQYNAQVVVSWYFPIPATVTKIEFYYVNTQWSGFSITI